jgi:hypothetical protein
MQKLILCAALSLGAAVATTSAQIVEVEPNNNKAHATPALLLDVGSTITGSSTGATNQAGLGSGDEFLISTAPKPLGIYRWRLRLMTPSQPHVVTIRGRNQVAGVIGTADVELCSSLSFVYRTDFAQWYGFGRSEQLYAAVTGTSATTQPYVVQVEMQPVNSIDIGQYPNAGRYQFSWENIGHMTNTDVWLYDAQFNAIPDAGNDDTNFIAGGSGSGTQSYLSVVLANGTYYLAVTDFELSNHLPAPVLEDYRNGKVLDFPGAVVNGSQYSANLTFRLTPPGPDGVGTLPRLTIPMEKTEEFQILFLKFTVGPIDPPPPACPADFNDDDAVSVQDIFDFLTAFSNGLATADFNGMDGVTVQDIFDFLTAWSEGCPG